MIFRSKKQLIKELQAEVQRLRDENESLWQMLDEIAASDIQNYQNLMEEMLMERKLDSLMITNKKVDA